MLDGLQNYSSCHIPEGEQLVKISRESRLVGAWLAIIRASTLETSPLSFPCSRIQDTSSLLSGHSR